MSRYANPFEAGIICPWREPRRESPDKVRLLHVLLVLPYTVPCYQPLTTLPYLPNNVADFENNLNLFLIFLEYPVLFCN